MMTKKFLHQNWVFQFSAATLHGSCDDTENEHVDLNRVSNMHNELSNEQESDDESVDSIGIKQVSQSKDLSIKIN